MLINSLDAETDKIFNYLKFGCFFILIYYFNAFFVAKSIDSDQYFYHIFFEQVRSYNFLDGIVFYRSIVGASEPGYYLLIRLAAAIFERDFFISIVNTVFFILLWKFLKKLQVNRFVMILLSFNYYLMVLLFAAERLKFSFLFLLISTQILSFWRYFPLSLSIFSHFQTVFIYTGILSEKLRNIFPLGNFSKINRLKLIELMKVAIGVLCLFLCLLLYREEVNHKVGAYLLDGTFFDNVNLKILIFLTLLYT